MISHTYLCPNCRKWTTIHYTLDQLGGGVPRACECAHGCGGTARHTWREGPGLAGVTEPSTRGIKKTFEPGAYDQQAGRSFSSLRERDAYLKSRGLVALGPDEYRRTINTTNEPQPDFSSLPETMKEAWADLEAGKPAPPTLKLDDVSNVTITKE